MAARKAAAVATVRKAPAEAEDLNPAHIAAQQFDRAAS